jgi:hypothetical protein
LIIGGIFYKCRSLFVERRLFLLSNASVLWEILIVIFWFFFKVFFLIFLFLMMVVVLVINIVLHSDLQLLSIIIIKIIVPVSLCRWQHRFRLFGLLRLSLNDIDHWRLALNNRSGSIDNG